MGHIEGSTIDRLVLPNLRAITFDCTSASSFPPKFRLFIRRLSCPLERLTLLAVQLMSDDLINCLSELPSLIELEVHSVWYWY